jgi:transposase
VLQVEDWITIRELARQGISRAEIARRTGRDPKTVRKVLRAATPALRRRPAPPRITKLDPFREYLTNRSSQGCWNAVVLLEELRARGYDGQITRVRDFLAPLRADARRQREATTRFETAPGKQAQVDWGHFGRIWQPRSRRWAPLYAFVFTLGYSRAQYVTFTTSCDLEHFLECHLGAFAALGIPERVLYDNLKTAILGRQADGTPRLPGRFYDFALYYGFTPAFCQPYRARTKGKVERGIGYLRQNFWVRVATEVGAGTLDLPALNARAADWVATVAHPRVHGTTGEVVAARLAVEQPLLGRLDARPRYDTAYAALRRVSRDGRLSYRGQLYQVPLRYALGVVEVREALSGVVTLRSADGVRLPTMRVSAASATPPAGVQVTAARPTAGRLPLLDPLPVPVVPVRDLAVYEEVAHAAAAR